MVYTYDLKDGPIYASYPVGEYIHQWSKIAKIYAKTIAFHPNLINKESRNLRLVGRGSSGAILCSLTSVELLEQYGIYSEVIHIKKEGEMSHTNSRDYLQGCNRYIIIDDFVDSGNTIQSILNYADIKYKALLVSGRISPSLIELWKEKIENFFVTYS